MNIQNIRRKVSFKMNGIKVAQRFDPNHGGRSCLVYSFHSKDNLLLGGIVIPSNARPDYTVKALNVITKTLVVQWGLNAPKK